MKKLLCVALIAGAASAYAQNVPVATNSAKKDLVQRVVSLQQPSVDALARNMAERPLRQMMAQAEQVLQSLPEDKRQAAASKVEAVVGKYVDETGALVKAAAGKVGQPALAPVFEEKFSEDELRQLLVALESPAFKKYQQSLPDLNSALTKKLEAELRPQLEPKLQALGQQVGAALGVTGGEPEKDAKPAAAKPKAKK